MSNVVKLKSSGTASATPSSLEYGELALNYNDEKIFYKNSSDQIVEFDLNASGVSGTVFNATIGNDTDLQFTINHNFGSRDVAVFVREAFSPYSYLSVAWEATTINSITLYFDSAPDLNSIRVSIYLAVAGNPSNLDGLSDVVISSLSNNQVLKYNGSNWVNESLPSSVSSITAGTGLTGGTITLTGTISIDSTVVTLSGTQTLINKTLTSPVISTIINTGTLTLPTSTDTLVGRDTTDTLTNKTLTSPVISTIVNTGTLTLPTSTDTLVGRDTTDTLTNKTLTSPSLNSPTLTLSTSSSTSDGVISWDSTTKKIKIGNGSISLDFASTNITQNQQTASYILVISDKDKMVEMNVSTANTVTVPDDSAVNFPIGSQITVLQTGTGQTTITPGSGVTVNATPGLKLRARWSSVLLIKRASNTWVALGDLQA